MAEITCTLKEFTYFVDPRIRLNVANMTRQSKNLLGSECQKCHEKKQLDAAHKHGSSRKEIIRDVLENYKINDQEYKILNLQKVIDEINNAHVPLEDHILFLCKTCHNEYDSWTKNLDDVKPPEPSGMRTVTTTRYTRTKNLDDVKPQELTIHDDASVKISDITKRPNPNYKDGDVEEILCKDEIHSWKYKLGWTSKQNRKNIEELISKIELNFNCYPVAFKSWYYHNRKDNNKQLSGIICSKNRSEICFRIDPISFLIDDSRIIHGKRWFFPTGKEKRVEIIPENYDLIMKCLHYAFQVS